MEKVPITRTGYDALNVELKTKKSIDRQTPICHRIDLPHVAGGEIYEPLDQIDQHVTLRQRECQSHRHRTRSSGADANGRDPFPVQRTARIARRSAGLLSFSN